MKNKKKATGLLTFGLSLALACSLGMSTIAASAGPLGGKYYPDYPTYDEALEAAGEINLEVAEEGNVLLKNDGTLPLTGKEYVSVFGVSSAVLVGGSGNTNSIANGPDVSDRGAIYDSLVGAGFTVNPMLADYYSGMGGAANIGSETTQFSAALESTFNMYNDAAVIVLSRNAGEGADADTVTDEPEDNKYKGEDMGWRHEALYTADEDDTDFSSVANEGAKYKADGDTEYKHYLQLTDSEEALIEYVEGRFDKVVVVLNTANAMEVYNLKADPQINAILLMGRPGETGHMAVGEILAGLVNPSGKLVDEWNTDFTADPTWYNFGYGVQVGTENMYRDGNVNTTATLNPEKTGNDVWGTHDAEVYYGTDYEEDIYLGYAYWETYYYEYYQSLLASSAATAAQTANDWWEKNVAYSFGHGLSYTSFSFNIEDDDIYATGNNGAVSGFDLATSDLETLFASAECKPAQAKTLYIPVTVTNTGSVAGKQVVQVYVSAPYDAETASLEKSFVTLVGYAKTDELAPGQSQTVDVQVNVQDMASFDYNDKNEKGGTGYELDPGTYTIRAMASAHYDVATDVADTEDAYDEITFSLDSVVELELDDFSDNLATALFSEERGTIAESTDEKHYLKYNSLRTADLMASGGTAMEQLSRATIVTKPLPAAPDIAKDLTFNNTVVKNWNYWDDFDTSDQESDPWYREIGSDWGWDQGQGVADPETGLYDITLDEMMGIPLYDETTKSGFNAQWDKFMNQLTIDELKLLVERQNSMWTTSALATIGKRSSTQADSYNDVRTAGGTFLWVDSPTLSATWNADLSYRVGVSRGNIEILNGWSGWGGAELDTHRSPFSGRNAEYLSQDGIQGGYMAAAMTLGIESRGVTCYLKHFAFNDMETNRDGMCNNVWVSEQAARQIYLKVFQMAMQEGGASGAMTGFARLCGVPLSSNNQVLEQLVVKEWGWEGFYITDGYSGVSQCTTMESMMRGYCIPLPLGGGVPNIQGTWNAATKTVSVDGKDNDTQYYYLRATAARILYADAKSNDVLNGFYLAEVSSDTIEATQGKEMDDVSVTLTKKGETKAMDLDGSTAVYSLAEGSTLPAGLSFSSDGTFSGTPTQAGTFTVTVECLIDGWVSSELASGLKGTYTFEIASSFGIKEGSDTSAEVGKDFWMQIETVGDAISADSTVKYSVISGDIASFGLSITEEGVISGTPTKAGILTFTVQAAVSNSSAGGGQGGGMPGGGGPSGPGGPGGSGGSSATNYTYDVTLTVTGGATEEETTVTDISLNADGNIVITFSDGTERTITAQAGKTIADIKLDENGNIAVTYTDGTTATLTLAQATEEGGCGSSIAATAGIGIACVLLAAGAVLMVCRKKESR